MLPSASSLDSLAEEAVVAVVAVPDSHSTQLVESSASESGMGDLVYCVFDCGPARHHTLCTNTGTRASPRWMCQPCNGARKAFEYAASRSSSPVEARLAIKRLKETDPEQCKAKVRAARIKCPH